MNKKIIVVKQHDIKDCGVCSLASIIQYHGGYVPFERLRLDTNTTKDGTNALSILEAAKKYGFAVKGILVDSLDNLDISMPVIAHLDFKNGYKHFVVIYNISPQKVILMDPARGKVVMKRKEFEKSFTKVILMFYPQNNIAVFEKEIGIDKIIIKLLKNNKALLIIIFVISLIVSILSVISSYYFKIVIDNINNFSKTIVIVFFIILIFKCVFYYLRLYLENYLSKRIDVLLFKDFFEHLYFLPLLSISSRNSGDIVTRVKELNNLKSIFIELVSDILLNFLFMLLVVPLLISINIYLFIILIISLLLYCIIVLFNKDKIYQKAYTNLSYEEDYNSYLIETINSYESIKNLNVTDYVFNNVIEKNNNYICDTFKLNSYLNKIWFFKSSINELTFFIVNTMGFLFLFQNNITITSLVTFTSLMLFFLEPIKNLLDMIPRINYIKATITKINEFISIPKERLGNNVALSSTSIDVSNLRFGYNLYNTVINNKSFVINDGSKVMLKGESGCGKSSFCKILLKYFDNYQGTIKIGNIDLKNLSLSTIRNNIVYVSQNEKLFNDTIKNNLIMGRNISSEKLNKVMDICLINSILDKKKFGLDTFISSDDNCFSGGEKQRILLARSLLKDAKIIILDEALSEVDFNMERTIINNIKNNYKDKTLIYITHKKQDDLFDDIIIFNSDTR